MVSDCITTVDEFEREEKAHGSQAFPVAAYRDDLVAHPVPWHWHDELEAAIVTEGATVVGLGRSRIEVGVGQGFFVNSGVLHNCVLAKGHDGCHMRSLVFHARLVGGAPGSVFFERYVNPVTGRHGFEGTLLDPGVEWQDQALEAVERAWNACAWAEGNFELHAREQLSDFMAILCTHVDEVAPAGGDARTPRREEERLKLMLARIEEGYARDLQVADIAAAASVSATECTRCFRSVLGTTPIAYLRDYRIDCAEKLLRATLLPVSEVASSCGFNDVSYFSKTFKQLKGVSPRDVRKLGA